MDDKHAVECANYELRKAHRINLDAGTPIGNFKKRKVMTLDGVWYKMTDINTEGGSLSFNGIRMNKLEIFIYKIKTMVRI